MNNYQYIKELIDEGYLVTFNDTNTGKKLIIVSDEGGDVISFPRGRMSYEKYMAKLNSYAKEYLEDNEHHVE